MGLPASITAAAVWSVLIPVATVTLVLRALPFVFRRVLRGSPLLDFLGITMPVGVMTVLVVYSIGGAESENGGIAAALLAAAATLGLHAWRRSMALSILAGTAIYMVFVNWVF
ncbi:AzlD domain-containing protein [Corynebacterium sp. Q4381]|uniref:branched-chain amino acid transporter permease n=1 Tax=Corynebacterium sp. Marseille-Q4381 TaxID=3121597 RepID=UPI002FE63561